MQSSAMYPTYGDEIDWLYGTQRVFSYTFEMYPTATDTSPSRHYPPDELIGRETRRNRDAVLYLMEQADCPYRAIGKAASYCGPLYDDFEVAAWLDDRPRRHRHGQRGRLAARRSRSAGDASWARPSPAGRCW